MQEPEPHPSPEPARERAPVPWIRILLAVLFVVALYILQRRLDLLQYFSRDQVGATLAAIRSRVDGLGVWGPVLFALTCAVAMAANFPTFLVIYMSVTLFGRLRGCLLAFLVVAIGVSLIYVAGQWLGRPLVQRLFGRRLEKLEARLSRRELMNIVMLRLVLFMNPAFNWVLGLSGIRYRNLLLGTLLGAGPGIILLAWLLGTFTELLESGASLDPLQTPQLLVPLVLAVVLFGVVRVVDRFYQRRQAQKEVRA
jgi:uncharacterized membrane protein YdjX (TVP38/TMEM64 family)